jgi:hypothetical protein
MYLTMCDHHNNFSLLTMYDTATTDPVLACHSQIHFNASHHICGACIRTYLLEKSRLVRGPGPDVADVVHAWPCMAACNVL